MTITALYYFGDSFSDAGALFELSSEAIDAVEATLGAPTGLAPIPVSPPYDGVFSDGPVFTQIAPGLLGLDDDAVFNFAAGAAQAVGALPFAEIAAPVVPPAFLAAAPPEIAGFDVNLGAQVERFLAQAAIAPPPPGAAANLLIGPNDLLNFAPSSEAAAPFEALALVGDIVDAILDAARTIAGAGVDTVILNTLPAASFFPASNLVSAEEQELAELLVGGVNAGLRLGALGLSAEGIDVRIVDLNALTDAIEADPGGFGIQETEEPALLGTGTSIVENPAVDFDALGFGPDQLLFFDLVHPTTATHGVIAAFSAASLTADLRLGTDFSLPVFGDGGRDLILAQDGDDAVFAFGGSDIALGGLGNDVMRLGSGSDLGNGGSGNDTIFGGSGVDVAVGAAGDDLIRGGSGGDGLAGGLGSDAVHGGLGGDLFLYVEESLIGGDGSGVDHYFGGLGFDRLALALSAETLAVEQAAFEAGFTPGRAYTFQSFDLTIRGIEEVVFTDGFGFGFAPGETPDVAVSGALADRLAEADLFGFV